MATALLGLAAHDDGLLWKGRALTRLEHVTPRFGDVDGDGDG